MLTSELVGISRSYIVTAIERSGMSTILLSVDNDESRAKSQAESLTRLDFDPESTHVRLFHVFTDNPSGASVTQVGSVRRAKEILENAGYAVSLEGQSGEPAEEILTAAEEHDVDAISIAGRKRSPTGKALFGSVTQEVFLNTDLPVLLTSASKTE